MAERKKYTVARRVKVRGDWRDPGDQVLLTEAERGMYAHALEGEATGTATRPPAPGYSTRPMTGAATTQRPLKAAQEEAGAPEATRPGGTEPQSPSLEEEQDEAGAQEAATAQDAEPEGESLAEQTTEDDDEALADVVPHYSYLEKEGSYTTREAIANATDEELEAVAYISAERRAEIREVVPHAQS